MLCENCNEREADIIYTVIADSEKTVKHLCPICAGEQGVETDTTVADLKMSAPAEALADMVEQQASEAGDERDEQVLRCPTCGLSHEEFRQRYRLGCADCFEAFRERLGVLLTRVHGADSHTGKHPTAAADETSVDSATWKLEVLNRRLKAAVEREEFEEAVHLRDQIEAVQAAVAGEATQ